MIATEDGTLRAVDPDGHHPVLLGGDEHDPRRHGQPVLSPDGEEVAWSVIGGDDGLDAAVAVARTDGTDQRELPLVFPAFYLYWRPDGAAVAALGNGPLGLELTVVDVRTGDATIVERAAPLFFDWSGGGDLCAHAGPYGDDRVVVIPSGQPAAPHLLGLSPGRFTAPAWHPDGRQVMVASGSELVLVDAHTTATSTVAPLDGPARFGLDPWGERVAMVGRAGHDGLVLVDLATGAVEPVTVHPPVAWWWHPFGDRLLVLVAGMVGGSPWVRHVLWADGEVQHEGMWHRPSQMTAREILPFPEQYGRSHSLWSPDGESYAYEGVAIDGAAGVWVQRLDDTTPAFLGPGAVVWWS